MPAAASTRKRAWSLVLNKEPPSVRAWKSSLVHDLASGALVTVVKVTSDVSCIFHIETAVACIGFWLTKHYRHSITRRLEPVHRYILTVLKWLTSPPCLRLLQDRRKPHCITSVTWEQSHFCLASAILGPGRQLPMSGISGSRFDFFLSFRSPPAVICRWFSVLICLSTRARIFPSLDDTVSWTSRETTEFGF